MIEVTATPKHFLGMPVADFLRDYWQKQPLLIRQAFPGYEAPLTPEDLAGLACEDARACRASSRTSARRDDWRCARVRSPRTSSPKLGKHDWTLLVQDMDKWDMDVRALLDRFRFLPRWRVDDVMISFADARRLGRPARRPVRRVPAAGAGPTPLADRCPRRCAAAAFRPDVDLKLLQHFIAFARMGAGAGRHALPAAGRAPPRRSRRRLHDVLDRHARAVAGGTAGGPGRGTGARPCRKNRATAIRTCKSPPTRSKSTTTRSSASTQALAACAGHGPRRQARLVRALHHPLPRRPATFPRRPRPPAWPTVGKSLREGGLLLRHPFARAAWTKAGKQARLFVSGDCLRNGRRVGAPAGQLRCARRGGLRQARRTPASPRWKP